MTATITMVTIAHHNNNGLPTLLHVLNDNIINPFTIGIFAENHILKLIKLFSGHCLTKMSQNCAKHS